MRYPNPTPAPRAGHDQARQAWRRPQRQGHARTFPFPNPEAKTASADGTAPARVWESRTPPPAHHKGGPPRAPLLFPHTHRHTAPHTHTGHREPHTRTATHTTKFATPATVNTTVRGHTATRTPKTTHTTKFATPHRIFEHRFWARAFVWADGVERGWACVGLLTASRALSALFAAEPLVSQSLEGPLSGRGSGSVVRVLTRV